MKETKMISLVWKINCTDEEANNCLLDVMKYVKTKYNVYSIRQFSKDIT